MTLARRMNLDDMTPWASAGPQVATLSDIRSDGVLMVTLSTGEQRESDWLISPLAHLSADARLVAGDAVLVLERHDSLASGRLVVLGKIGPYRVPEQATLSLANELTLQCGQSSIALRGDGQVLIKGEDVTVRAKGTQRIRAGTVSIN